MLTQLIEDYKLFKSIDDTTVGVYYVHEYKDTSVKIGVRDDKVFVESGGKVFYEVPVDGFEPSEHTFKEMIMSVIMKDKDV